MEIWAQTLIKNEERWLWYSVTSVIDHVDKLLLWDTGSTDGSGQIEKELVKKYPDKIILKQKIQDTAEEFTKVRQEMLEETKSDWFIVVDGDEIWYENSIKKVIEMINDTDDNIESVVVPTINLVGDIFHHQDSSSGKYKIAGKVGHFNLRAINRNIPGLQSLGPHGKMGWTDGSGKMIQDRGIDKIKLIDAPYLHATNIERSDRDRDTVKRLKKLKYEFGLNFAKDYFYPEAFFKDRPNFIKSPWITTDSAFKFRAFFETPLRKIKRMVWKGGVGY